MCTPYLFNGVRRSTQAWLHNLSLFSTIFIQYDNLPSSKDNRYILSSFLAFFELIFRKRAKFCNQACVERRTPLNKYGVHIAVKCVVRLKLYQTSHRLSPIWPFARLFEKPSNICYFNQIISGHS